MLKKYAVFLLIPIFLFACSTEDHGLDSKTAKGAGAGAVTGAFVGSVSGAGAPMGAGIGAALGGAIAYMFSEKATVLQSLSAKGVRVMRLGDEVTLIIPSKNLFQGYSSLLSSSGKDLLQEVIELLDPMNKLRITISAYADSPVQSDKDLFLTDKQAQSVGNYLWDHHLDARLIYTIGYGGGHAIDYASDVISNDIIGKTNYRIEIHLKDYIG